MGSVVAILPGLPPGTNRVEIPDAMTPEDQATLLRELSGISTAVTRTSVQAEERGKATSQRFRAVDARLRKLEKDVEDTGEHHIEQLRAELKTRQAESIKWKWWLISIASTLLTSAVVGLAVHYLATR